MYGAIAQKRHDFYEIGVTDHGIGRPESTATTVHAPMLHCPVTSFDNYPPIFYPISCLTSVGGHFTCANVKHRLILCRYFLVTSSPIT